MLPVASEAVLAAAAVATGGGGGRGGGGGHGQALCVHVGGEGTRTRHAVHVPSSLKHGSFFKGFFFQNRSLGFYYNK